MEKASTFSVRKIISDYEMMEVTYHTQSGRKFRIPFRDAEIVKGITTTKLVLTDEQIERYEKK